MNDQIPDWLPDLILLENYKGDWKAFINAVYQSFHKDFVNTRPFFEELPLFARYHPSYEEKGAAFWHLISEGNIECDRIPDLRRCERIRWPRPIIEKANSEDVKIWETYRPWKGQQQRRINFSIYNFGYIVVIAENSRGFDLVTAYCVEKTSRKEKLRNEFDIFLKQKKEGSAVKTGPKLLLHVVDE